MILYRDRAARNTLQVKQFSVLGQGTQEALRVLACKQISANNVRLRPSTAVGLAFS